MSSYLSPLPQYPTPRVNRSATWATLRRETDPISENTDLECRVDPRHRLLHPLYSQPQRHYHFANGHQRQHHDVTTIPHLRRPEPPVQEWTLRHYSTQPLVCARPSTVNRYEVTRRIYPMDEWTDRINECLDGIGRTARSMQNWEAIRPGIRYMLRPLVPVHTPRRANTLETSIRA